MPSRSQKIDPLKKPAVFMWSLLAFFILIFGAACFIGFNSYRKASEHAIRSNEMRANLLGKIILEHQRAAIGVLRSYAGRPQVIDSVKNRDFEGTFKHLSALVKNNPEMEITFVADPAGIVWVNFPTYREVLNQDMSHRDWYKGVSKEWTPYVSRVYKTVIGEKDLAVAVCAPIRDENDKIIGILAASQTTGFFNRLISEVGLNADSKITLVDQEGHMIYSNRIPYGKEVIAYPSLPFVKKAMRKGEENVTIRDPSDGDKVKYVSFQPIDGTNWSVFVEKGKSEVLRSQFTYFIQIGIIAFLLFTVVVLFLAYSRQKHKRAAELGRMNVELEERVGRRTAELETTNRDLEKEIAEREASEGALRQSELKYRIVAENPYDWEFWLNMEGKYVYVSPSCKRVTGRDTGEFLRDAGLRREIIFPEDLHIFDRHRQEEEKEEIIPKETQYRIVHTDGSLHWIGHICKRVFDEQGCFLGIRGTNRDITGRMEAEKELREKEEKAVVELERQVQERTKELSAEIEERRLAEEALRESEKELRYLSSQLLMAQEKERREIAGDLHDNVWQILGTIKFDIQNLFSRQGDGTLTVSTQEARRITSNIRQAVEKIRTMQGDLWPPVLEDIGLLATIKWYCREFEKGHAGITIENQIRVTEEECPEHAKIIIYRIMQEALNNVARHSGATRVSLILRMDGQRIEFTVADNGKGFDVERILFRTRPWIGFGIAGMRQRVEHSGGKFDVRSGDGTGTIIRASWPLQQDVLSSPWT